ncbi:MAG: 2-phosphosulfolactate phosphatase [Christensenellales bacterium]
MKINVYVVYDLVQEKELKDQTAIILDTLRASTTIVTAMNNGCKQVIPVSEVEEAVNSSNSMGRAHTVLGGERETMKIPGFDLGNSPLDYTEEAMQNKQLVFTSSNGTKAILRARLAKNVLIGAMINDRAVAEKAVSLGDDIAIVCAGTEGQLSLDDLLTAGSIITLICNMRSDVDLDDAATLAKEVFASAKDDLVNEIKKSAHCKKLIKKGFKCDVEYCLQRNIVKSVPVYSEGVISLP